MSSGMTLIVGFITLRKWYGNNDYYVYWKDNGYSIRTSLDEHGRIKARLGGLEYAFSEGIEMSRITSGTLGFRYSPEGFVYESSTNNIFQADSSFDLFTILGYFNSKVADHFLSVMNPTINVMPEDIRRLPCCQLESKELINQLVSSSIQISKKDWDSFETSWDYTKHPLLVGVSVQKAFETWKNECDSRYYQLKSNEEQLNHVFIDIYGLQDELTPEVDNNDITVRRAELPRDIRSLLSYGVGCMFGRYSLDKDGLAYAGGEWTNEKYCTFIPSADHILPVTGEEYFDNDVVGLLCAFLEKSYGADTVEENISFIGNSLGGKGYSSRDIIRNYFLKDFFRDHCKLYQKRPIYWLFDSGPEGGFKALIYMHRYDPDTVARVRTDYLHPLQKKYEAEVERLDFILETDAPQRDKTAARKQREKLLKQIEECRVYDQAIAHVASQRIEIDLDDGVIVNYAKFQGVEISQGEGRKPLVVDLLAKI